MPNDAKLGMLAGVCGVLVAAVLLGQPRQPLPPADALAGEKGVAQPAGKAATPAPSADAAEPPSTPIARTRKDADAQPASRQAGPDDEP
jgi:hypothetical protein